MSIKQSSFEFLNFTLAQSSEVFKLTTDSLVLAGSIKAHGMNNALEVGTGSGVISLLLADRFHNLKMDALDINSAAVALCEKNILCHPNGINIEAHQGNFSNWQKNGYDLVLTNPPYFKNALKSKVKWKSIARHDVDWNWSTFFHRCDLWLNLDGEIALIIPISTVPTVIAEAELQSFFLNKKCSIQDNNTSSPHLFVLHFNRSQVGEVEVGNLVLKTDAGRYTNDYKGLLKGWVNWSHI